MIAIVAAAVGSDNSDQHRVMQTFPKVSASGYCFLFACMFSLWAMIYAWLPQLVEAPVPSSFAWLHLTMLSLLALPGLSEHVTHYISFAFAGWTPRVRVAASFGSVAGMCLVHVCFGRCPAIC